MTRISGVRSRWLLAVGGVAVAAAAVACQSSPDDEGPAVVGGVPSVVQAAPSPSSPPGDAVDSGRTRPPPTELRRCHTADLAVEVGQSDSGVGHTGLNLALVNRSTHYCGIYGYGGLQLLDASEAALATQQVRGGPAPKLIILRPGGRAHSSLTWVFSPEARPCAAPASLLVTPPDETESIRVAFSHTVCGNGRIQQAAYQTAPV